MCFKFIVNIPICMLLSTSFNSSGYFGNCFHQHYYHRFQRVSSSSLLLRLALSTNSQSENSSDNFSTTISRLINFPDNSDNNMASDTRAPTDAKGKVREKVALKPGFHLADWTRLQQTMTNPTTLQDITPEELAKHNTQFDMWTAYKGKVYNITNYLPYHPGGDSILKKGAAGKDCTELFEKYHRWVNMDGIVGKCLIGRLIDKPPAISEDGDEEEDSEADGKPTNNEQDDKESK
jgi:cytochrome b involved in lipid metabolism